ncbi:HtrA2 peptidase [Thermincola ferriacetica]|uniref:HtrA2 peptidase n=1 Tax=Thermincola ferriacetica TaxID=281456 RepID=A0A0L6W3B7_9FIRM|nr:trypsin-like peptidase domain-containing protein [Thermincola ferriacetica]KNZ69941.1 HtrA2 peptidase [Thermincola ferriacetica]
MSMETKPKFIRAVAATMVSFLVGAMFVLGGIFAYANYFSDLAKTQTGAAQNVVPASLSVSQANKLPDIAGIVKKVSPAIVNIETVTQISGNSYFTNPFYRDFFGRQMPYHSGAESNRGVGSGFIINKDGYILTNEHVIHGASEINVKVVSYDRPFKAKVIGSDYDLDLAVIKIDAGKDLPYLKMGDSNQVNAGDWAIAIGNPYGLDHTVTVGVVSAKGRPVTIDSREYKNLLQTDAAINPGNSGGPLLNLAGEVIGINTAVNAEAQGIGFAIPTSTVADVLKDLLEKGKVVRPYMGVNIQTLDSSMAQYYGIEKTEGVIIANVLSGSPAEKAGLRAGDVIQKVNGKTVTTAEGLQEIVQKSKVNDKLVVEVYRDGTIKKATVVLAEK